MKKILLIIIFILSFNIRTFAESGFVAILNVPVGLSIGIPIGVHVGETLNKLDVNAGVNTKLGYMFDFGKLGFTPLLELGYSYDTYGYSYFQQVRMDGSSIRVSLNESINTHSIQIGLIPKFNIDNFAIGLGFGLNFGGMYRQNETLAFTLDLTNVASFRKYYFLNNADFAEEYDGFDEMDVYYQPMDLVLKALWDYGPYHLVVEFSDVINQVIWDREVSGYDYNFFAIPKLGFTYDINEDFSINTHLGYSKLSFGIDFHNFTVEASTSLNKLGFGLSVGYSI